MLVIKKLFTSTGVEVITQLNRQNRAPSSHLNNENLGKVSLGQAAWEIERKVMTFHLLPNNFSFFFSFGFCMMFFSTDSEFK